YFSRPAHQQPRRLVSAGSATHRTCHFARLAGDSSDAQSHSESTPHNSAPADLRCWWRSPPHPRTAFLPTPHAPLVRAACAMLPAFPFPCAPFLSCRPRPSLQPPPSFSRPRLSSDLPAFLRPPWPFPQQLSF